MFDLSQFDKTPVYAPDNQIGVVLSLPLESIIEDPSQPRTEFDPEELAKFAEDVGRRGVQNPIAVRPPIDGVYQIIHGARRYRASGMAGLATIPAIVQVDEIVFDDYSQVLENTQRDNLTPLDIARFIQKRKALGESNSQIARNLSEKPEWVTYHLALIDMPPEIQNAYEAGQIRGAKTAYELRKLHSKSPESVQQLIKSGEEITQTRIRETVNPVKAVVMRTPEPDLIAEPAEPVDSNKPGRADPETSVQVAGAEELVSRPKTLASPCVIGIYQGNPVQVLIHLKPTEPGYAWIGSVGKSTQQEEEVLAEQITLTRIEEQNP